MDATPAVRVVEDEDVALVDAAHVALGDGPDRGRELQLPANPVVKIGSSASADVVVTGDPLLDPEHFVIEISPESEYQIRNLAPKRPARLNGRPVTLAPLRSGDVIQAGLTALQFHFADAALADTELRRPAAEQPNEDPAATPDHQHQSSDADHDSAALFLPPPTLM